MKNFFIVVLAAASALISTAQVSPDACTSIMVGRKASADGSVMTSHTCDSRYRTWMRYVPAADNTADTVTAIYRGRMHTQHPASLDGMTETARIPQAAHTYKFLDTAYPCMNEHQLAMGETTYVGRDTMVNRDGAFMIEELQRIALERCTTARDAIKLMGALAQEYGFGDSGECLTIADPREVWIFEIQGQGPDTIGAVWAAQRIPDDHIAVSANVSRIGRLNLDDPDNFMASDNVMDVALRMGLWDGKEEFSFWKAYSGGNYLKEPKNYSVRELYIMQQLAPEAGFDESWEELPVSVRPSAKVSVEDVARLLGSYYEGTPLNLSGRLMVANQAKKGADADNAELPDSIVSPRANPWMRPDEIAVYEAMGDTAMHNIRTVSVSWCSYSTIIQCRDWLPDAVGGVAWVCLDNPGESPRFPLFAGGTELPRLLGVCGHGVHRNDAALWRFREPNRLATVRWGNSRKLLEPARDHFIRKGVMEQPWVIDTYRSIEKADGEQAAIDFLNNYQRDFFGAAVQRWEELGDLFWLSNANGF